MISFTELEPHEAYEHGKKFGNFGIMISPNWAAKNHAQRVIYVSETGPFTEALHRLFSIGSKDLESRIEHPDDNAWQRSFENKAIASYVAGASLWANLLTIWEYLEPESSSAQREWRIVNDGPDYSIAGVTKDIIAAVSPPLNWAKFTRVLPVSATDIEQFVCPASKLGEFQSAIPKSFEGVPIVQTDG